MSRRSLMASAMISWVAVLLLAILYTAEVALAQVPPALRDVCESARSEAQERKLSVGPIVHEMLSLPTEEAMLAPSDTAQAARIARYSTGIARSCPVWFSDVLSGVPARMVPLAERVEGMDSFGATYDGPLGVGYVRATYGFYFVCLVPSATALGKVPPDALVEYKDGEADGLTAVDKARLAATRLDLARQRFDDPEARYFELTRFPAGSAVANPPLKTLSEAQDRLSKRGLATAYLLLGSVYLRRSHWWFYDAGFGLVGESLLVFPADTKCDVASTCTVKYAFFVRFLATRDLVALCVSRHPDVYHGGVPSSSPAEVVGGNWFARDYR